MGECILSSFYIENLELGDLIDFHLSDLKIKLINGDDISVLDAAICESDSPNSLKFTTPAMHRGEHRVLLAIDGQNFIDTETKLIGYEIECVECSPNLIILSECAPEQQTLDFEMRVRGFVAADSEHIKIKFVGADEKSFVTECAYESQSFRDIAAAELETKALYEAKRTEIDSEESAE